MIAFPNAKINIGLNVINRRPDGYHNLETVFYPIKLNDVLEVIESNGLTFESAGLPIPGRIEDNLCLKGYELLRADFDLPPVSIYLYKHIPIGAGLGGGSADAAFFIRLLSDYFKLDLADEQMIDYARQLGADCAFFIKNTPMFATGIGDDLQSVKIDLSAHKLVLVMPPVHLSTGEAYRGVKPASPEHSLKELVVLPVTQWKHHVKNDFEESVFRNHPGVRGVKAALYQAGATYACMSGSGSSVFALFSQVPDLSTLKKDNQVFYL